MTFPFLRASMTRAFEPVKDDEAGVPSPSTLPSPILTPARAEIHHRYVNSSGRRATSGNFVSTARSQVARGAFRRRARATDSVS